VMRRRLVLLLLILVLLSISNALAQQPAPLPQIGSCHLGPPGSGALRGSSTGSFSMAISNHFNKVWTEKGGHVRRGMRTCCRPASAPGCNCNRWCRRSALSSSSRCCCSSIGCRHWRNLSSNRLGKSSSRACIAWSSSRVLASSCSNSSCRSRCWCQEKNEAADGCHFGAGAITADDPDSIVP